MGLKECEIKLDSPINTYYAGQIINGTVIYTFDSPKKVRGIKIQFLGEARTSWVESEKVTTTDGKEENQRKDVTGHEEYFQISYYVLGGVNAGETELHPGAHSYPFTCSLPPMLPSSFEGELGHVRYTIKVTLDRPWKFDQETKMAFTVISPVDLNLMEKAREPGKLVMEKTFCCWCCASPPLSVVVSIPVKGYVPGQTIPLLVEIDNRSNVEVEKIKFEFRKNLAFHTSAPRLTKRDTSIIGELSVGPFKMEQRTIRQTLDIPPLPPSNLDNCGIIDLHYDLNIVCQVVGMHTSPDGIIPITIGTVPLKDYQPQAPASQQAIDISMMPTQPVSPDNVGGAVGWNMAGGQLYPNVPPPNFSEGDFFAKSIKGQDDNEFTRLMGNQEAFAPRYPVYTFQPSAPSMD